MPDQYRSEAVIVVVPQTKAELYGSLAVAPRLDERLETIRMQLLGRSGLERIITELDLYTAERATSPMDVVVDRMRENIGTRVVRENAFGVSFVAYDPTIAQQVT